MLIDQRENNNTNMIRFSPTFHLNIKMGLAYMSAIPFSQISQQELLHKQPTRNLTSTVSTTNPDNLPHYPVPKFEDTLNKYLRSVQPLLTSEALRKTEQIVHEFGKPNGVGQRLHSLLLKRAESSENWLTDWWLMAAYLSFRLPVVVHSNPGLFFEKQEFANDKEWLRYTSKVIWATLRFKQMIDNKEIPTDKMGKLLLDMGQYGRIFGTCRIPAKDVDRIEYNPNSKYAIVAFQNEFYKLPVYSASSNNILTENEIQEQLFKIVDRNAAPTNAPVGAITSEHRDTLATAYEKLIKDPQNKKSVDCITKGLFIVCLDKNIPLDSNVMNTASHQFIHGGGSRQNSANRWFDKTLQLIVNENGLSGLNYEHSPGEGQPIAVLSDFIINHTKTNSKVDSTKSGSYETPTKLNFTINDSIERDINTALNNIDKLSSDLHMNVLNYQCYGKNFIKQQKMSPDSYLQMAMQYAFYKYHGLPGAHYETAQQRMFIHGRTETIRSCSIESVEFARAMCDSAVSDEKKVQLLKAAVNGHKNYTTMAMSGAGIDRHLLGLKLIAKENGIQVPELYSDEAFTKSTSYRISTSQVASPNKIFMCYGPAVEDGYGICYNPRNDDMLFAISSIRSNAATDSDVMAKQLSESLDDMYKVLIKAGEKPKSKM